jgi:hypothetical protein
MTTENTQREANRSARDLLPDDLSGCRRPADAVRRIESREADLEERERDLLNIQTGEDPQTDPAPRYEAELAEVQGALATLEEVCARLTRGVVPLEVYPTDDSRPACYPRWEKEARERGHRLHLDLVRIGYTSEEERRDLVAEVLELSYQPRFRTLTAEEVRDARAQIPGLGVAEREEPSGDRLPAPDVVETETGARMEPY